MELQILQIRSLSQQKSGLFAKHGFECLLEFLAEFVGVSLEGAVKELGAFLFSYRAVLFFSLLAKFIHRFEEVKQLGFGSFLIATKKMVHEYPIGGVALAAAEIKK